MRGQKQHVSNLKHHLKLAFFTEISSGQRHPQHSARHACHRPPDQTAACTIPVHVSTAPHRAGTDWNLSITSLCWGVGQRYGWMSEHDPPRVGSLPLAYRRRAVLLGVSKSRCGIDFRCCS